MDLRPNPPLSNPNGRPDGPATDDAFDRWRRSRLAEGFDEVLVREWPAGQALPEHTHPFGVSALVVRGEFWLGCAGASRHLKAGDGFALAGQVPHTERYGAEGATVWVARRHAG